MKVVKVYSESIIPTKNKEDLGYDMYAVVSEKEQYHTDNEGNKMICIEPGQTKLIDLGVKIGFPKKYGAFLKERSGLASKGIHIHGGVIDQSYTGIIKAVVYNSNNKPFYVKTGDRICQMVLIPLVHFTFEETEELEETERNDRGFGSSGT
jgi:dUTP pyrophosphatase